MAKKTAQKYNDAPRFGMSELYGYPIDELSLDERREFAEIEGYSGKICPFLQKAHPGHACNKKGGVCSIGYRRYAIDAPGHIIGEEPDVLQVGALATVCPNRFFQDNTVFKEIGRIMFGDPLVEVISEVDFLRALPSRRLAELDTEWDTRKQTKPPVPVQQGGLFGDGEEDPPLDEEGKPVGRLDLVVRSINNPSQWCPVEIQAVYFSGLNMKSHLLQHTEGVLKGNKVSLPFPDEPRRPDFRSSGLKRLMPQLMVKVPRVRAWGKKMVVVVDRRFFSNLANMKERKELSGSEIVWLVIDYDQQGKLMTHEVVYTSLDSAIIGLTAGEEMAQEDFEAKLSLAATKTVPKADTMKAKTFRA